MHHFFLSFQHYFEVGGDEGLHEEIGTQDGSPQYKILAFFIYFVQ
jgi:hypothetical protein